MERNQKTTLWDVIAALQSRLERNGLEPAVVDSVVVIGVRAALGRAAGLSWPVLTPSAAGQA